MGEPVITEHDKELVKLFISDEPGVPFEFGFPFDAYGSAIHGEDVLLDELPKLLAMVRADERARCAAIARSYAGTVGIALGLVIAEAIERGGS